MSNTADRIAELRKKITSAKGKIKRRRATIEELTFNVEDLSRQIRIHEDEIRSMGGKVKS